MIVTTALVDVVYQLTLLGHCALHGWAEGLAVRGAAGVVGAEVVGPGGSYALCTTQSGRVVTTIRSDGRLGSLPTEWSFYQKAPSLPLTKTSIRPLQVTAAGDEVSYPPRDSQPDQPFCQYLCHRARSVPPTKTSRRPEPHELTAGPVPG